MNLQVRNSQQMKTDIDLQADLKQPDESIDPLYDKLHNKKGQIVPESPAPQISPKKPVKKLDFSIDYNIPTLDEIAVPGNESSSSNITSKVLIPEHILKTDNRRKKNEGVTLSPEMINQLSEELQLALTKEIEKAIEYALNSALATVMDQTSKLTKTTVSNRVAELLPKLLKEHLKNISPE